MLTSTLEKKIDALDNWCLRCILHIHWMDFVFNDVVRSHTGQPLLSDTIRQWHLSFFGHLCHADIGQDHSRALRACIRRPPKDWRRRTGRPKQTWLRTVEDDLHPLNFSLVMARRRAMDRPAWRLLVDGIHPCDTLQREREQLVSKRAYMKQFTTLPVSTNGQNFTASHQACCL